MNSIQVTCGGNMFTKPMYCWSFLDSILLIGTGVLIYVVYFILTAKRK